MPIPGFQDIMLPLLKFAVDGKEHSIRDAIEGLAVDPFKLTDDERKELLPSGTQPIFDNRVGWTKTYLKKAGLLESKRRAYFNITEEGLRVLSQNPFRIDVKFLNQYPEFVDFHKVSVKDDDTQVDDGEDSETPEEILEYNYQSLRENLVQDITNNIRSCSPAFFEKLVVDLLLAMGYGGSRKDAGEAIGKSGDGGIDGIIKEDKLGLDTIYIQAKRWENTVSRPEIQKFAGALQGQQAKKGVFITTSHFSQGANDYASIIDSKIILIDGEQLAQLMIDYNIGVSRLNTYEIKKIDSDYFIED